MANLSNLNNKFLVTTGGNVGINVTNPSTKLVVTGGDDSAVTGVLVLTTSGGTNLKFGGATTYSWIQSHASKPLYINQLGNNVILNLAGGNVGIGTSTPNYKLEVNQNQSGTTYAKVVNQNTGVSATARMAVVGESAQLDIIATSAGYTGVSGWADAGVISSDSGASGGLILNSVAGIVKLQTLQTTALTINSSQNVGIGTTSPGTKFTVNQTKSGTGIENYDLIELGLLGTGAVGDSSTIGWFSTSGTKTAGIEGISGLDNILYGELAFHVRRYTTDTYDEVMRINNRGNVGIGTDSPDELLHLYKASGNTGLEIEAVSGGDPIIRFVSANNRTGDIFYTDATTLAKFSYDHSAQAFKTYAHNNTSVDFYVSETEAYFTQQNVGIGTTSPASKLDVNGGRIGIRNNIVAASNLTYSTIYSTENTGAAYPFTGTSGNLVVEPRNGQDFVVLGTSGVAKMVVKGAGNVGIGTASPDVKLHLASSPGPNIRMENTNTAIVSGESYGEIQWEGNDINSDANGVRASIVVQGYGAGTQGETGMYFRTSYIGNDKNQNRMTITHIGNVGIGTTGPSKKLDVQVAGGDGIRVSNSTNPAYYSDLLINYNDVSSMQLTCMGTSILQAGNTGNTVLASRTNKDIILSPSGTGNVGVNTTTPYSKLDIKGCAGFGAAINGGNATTSTTGWSQQNGGSLYINWGLGGSGSSGDTVSFTYNATSWKSWTLQYNFASTNGISYGVVGGYWNNSGSSSNQTQEDNLGVSVSVTHPVGQEVLVTFTFTAIGTHPMCNFVYMQSGGDGQPRMDRVTLNAVT